MKALLASPRITSRRGCCGWVGAPAGPFCGTVGAKMGVKRSRRPHFWDGRSTSRPTVPGNPRFSGHRMAKCALRGILWQTRNSHSGKTGPGGASGGGRLRMRGDFAPHSNSTPSAGTCRGGASQMRMSGFGFSTHFRCTVWKNAQEIHTVRSGTAGTGPQLAKEAEEVISRRRCGGLW